jgi:hypothetical protein
MLRCAAGSKMALNGVKIAPCYCRVLNSFLYAEIDIRVISSDVALG